MESEKEPVEAPLDQTGSWCQAVVGVKALRRKSGCSESERTRRREGIGLLSHRVRMLCRKEGVEEGLMLRKSPGGKERGLKKRGEGLTLSASTNHGAQNEGVG